MGEIAILRGLKLFLFFYLLVSAQSIRGQVLYKCPAYPDTIKMVQSGKSFLNCFLRGDENSSILTTIDGYPVIENKNGEFEYALIDSSGVITASGITAKNIGDRTLKETDFLKPHQNNISSRKNKTFSLNYSIANDLNYSLSSFPPNGTRNLLVLLIDFTDRAFIIPVNNINNLMNQVNYNNSGSFRDYWLANSYNGLTVNSTASDWYHAANNMAYYGSNSNGSDINPRLLVQEAIDDAENAGVDFSQYDNDNDGNVDGIIVVHSGYGEEAGGGANTIWSHHWTLGSYKRTYDGITIDDYAIVPELRNNIGSNISNIGVICHEFGHSLGLPDLYDTDASNGDSEGIGSWGLMGSGNWNNNGVSPSNLCAWSKVSLNWTNPIVISSSSTISLPNSSQNNIVYRINTLHAEEYFLLENRQRVGFDVGLPGTGLAVWHINTSKTSSTHIDDNDVNADESLKGVDLEEADGILDLDNNINRGDSRDLFPGTTCNHTFNDNSNPDSRTYSPIVNTNKALTNILELNNITYFNFIGYNSLSGPSVVCSSGATYTVNNLPSVDTIIWTKSNNLIYVSGQTTNNYIVKCSGGDPLPTAIVSNENYGSSGWVSATIKSACGDSVVISKQVWVGLPAYTPIVTGSSTMFCSQSLYVEKYNRNATWSVYGPLQIVGANYGHKCTVKGTESGVGWVYATNSNVCGSFRGELLVKVSCSSYSVFPNPVNSEVTISLLPDNSIDKSFQKDKSIKSIRVVDKSGITLYTEKYGSFTFETNIDLSRFTTGVYVIMINEGSDEESYTIVKQ